MVEDDGAIPLVRVGVEKNMIDKIIIKGDEAYKLRKSLTKIKSNGDKWIHLYSNKEASKFWVTFSPWSEMQGGGPLALVELDSASDFETFDVEGYIEKYKREEKERS